MAEPAGRPAPGEPGVAYGTPLGRWVLLATVLGSGMAQLDGTLVNVALPTIGRELHAGLTSLQWIVNAYTLTLASLLLLGGALGDRHGRKKVFQVGVLGFAAASLGCGLSPDPAVLIGLRAVQGGAAALLTPGSLAILSSVFRRQDRAAAVGAWSGLGGVATAMGPVVGGLLVQAVSWRLAFFINLPLAAVVVIVAGRYVPETRDPGATGALDVLGAVLAAAGLAGVVFALTEGPPSHWPLLDIAALLLGLVCLAGFLLRQARAANPLLPLSLFTSAQFSAANVVTFIVYAALGGALFLLPLQLQRVAGFTPVAAGSSLLPVTLVMLLLSARAGRLAQRIGPRLPMTVGPAVAGVGLLLMTRIGAHASYPSTVLPAVVVFALGLSLVVAPLTATVLAAAPDEHAGVASAVNNDVARTAQLLAVAVLPVAAGITPAAYADPARLSSGFDSGMRIAAAMLAAGGLLAFALVRKPLVESDPSAPEPSASDRAAARDRPTPHCDPSAPPLRLPGARTG